MVLMGAAVADDSKKYVSDDTRLYDLSESITVYLEESEGHKTH